MIISSCLDIKNVIKIYHWQLERERFPTGYYLAGFEIFNNAGNILLLGYIPLKILNLIFI